MSSVPWFSLVIGLIVVAAVLDIVVHDEGAGDLTYRNGFWQAERLLWLEGRRTGPDPEMVRISSRAVGDSIALQARAREFAIASENFCTAHRSPQRYPAASHRVRHLDRP